MSETWNIKIIPEAVVTRVTPEGGRLKVPSGEYMMREVDADSYEITGNNLVFTLSFKEVADYKVSKNIRFIDGDWPSK
jgi:hypothetical protein